MESYAAVQFHHLSVNRSMTCEQSEALGSGRCLNLLEVIYNNAKELQLRKVNRVSDNAFLGASGLLLNGSLDNSYNYNLD